MSFRTEVDTKQSDPYSNYANAARATAPSAAAALGAHVEGGMPNARASQRQARGAQYLQVPDKDAARIAKLAKERRLARDSSTGRAAAGREEVERKTEPPSLAERRPLPQSTSYMEERDPIQACENSLFLLKLSAAKFLSVLPRLSKEQYLSYMQVLATMAAETEAGFREGHPTG